MKAQKLKFMFRVYAVQRGRGREREKVLLEVLRVNLQLGLHYGVPCKGRRLHLFVGLLWESISDRVANIA